MSHNFFGASLAFFEGCFFFFGGSLSGACFFGDSFCFFTGCGGGELGDVGEGGPDGCPGDDGEGEYYSAAGGEDRGLMVGALAGDGGLDA